MADGIKSGKIESIYIRQDGIIDGAFDSGQVKALGRLAISVFKSRERLKIGGENPYTQTWESGPAIDKNLALFIAIPIHTAR